MAEAHQRDVRDDQDGQQGLQACMVLPNVTVLISFFFFNFNDVLPSSTLILPVNIFTWKKEKQCSPGNLHAVSHFKHPTCM